MGRPVNFKSPSNDLLLDYNIFALFPLGIIMPPKPYKILEHIFPCYRFCYAWSSVPFYRLPAFVYLFNGLYIQKFVNTVNHEVY